MFGKLEKLAEDSKKVDRSDKELEARIAERLERENSLVIEICSKSYKEVTKHDIDENYKKILRGGERLGGLDTKIDAKGNMYVDTTSLYSSLTEEALVYDEPLLNRYFVVKKEAEGMTKLAVYDFYKSNWKAVHMTEKGKVYRAFGNLKVDITRFAKRDEEAKNGK